MRKITKTLLAVVVVSKMVSLFPAQASYAQQPESFQQLKAQVKSFGRLLARSCRSYNKAHSNNTDTFEDAPELSAVQEGAVTEEVVEDEIVEEAIQQPVYEDVLEEPTWQEPTWQEPVWPEAVEEVPLPETSLPEVDEQRSRVSMIDINPYSEPCTMDTLSEDAAIQAHALYGAIQSGEVKFKIDAEWYGLAYSEVLAMNDRGWQVYNSVKAEMMPKSSRLLAKYGIETPQLKSFRLFSDPTPHTETLSDGSVVSETVVALVQPDYGALYEAEEKADLYMTVLDQYVAEARSLVCASMSEEQAFRVLSEWIINKLVYDKGYLGTPLGQNILEGKSVCEGYARALQLACRSVGIQAEYVTGMANGVYHAWNTVKLDGTSFWSDPTWADLDEYGIDATYLLSTQLWEDRVLCVLYD